MTKSEDKETIKKFANDINKNLNLLKNTYNEWKKTLYKEDTEKLAESEKYLQLFLENRAKIASVGVEEGSEQANVLGNNEENRNNRKKLMAIIEEKVSDAENHKEDLLKNTDNFFHFLENTIISFIVVSIISSLVASLVLIKKSITNPLLSIKDTMNRLNNGEREVVIKEINQSDEIGDMAKSIENFRLSLIENDKMTQEKEKETLAQLEKAKTMHKILDSFEKNIQNIVSSSKLASHNVEISAQNMVKTADNTNSQSLIVASAAEQTSMNVQTVASATEEMSASIQEISRQVSKSTEVAGRANNEAENTIQTVSELSNTVNKIGEVVSLIQSIASQTNLLALNATIEAARAGEAGKGFAVVASEVKALATQTANATEEIRKQIENVQGSTKNTVAAMDSIQKTIQEINTISSAVAAAIEEQNATTGEITRSVQEAANGTQQVSQNIQTVSIAANETGKNANDMLKELENLENKNKDLIDSLDEFLNKIKNI